MAIQNISNNDAIFTKKIPEKHTTKKNTPNNEICPDMTQIPPSAGRQSLIDRISRLEGKYTPRSCSEQPENAWENWTNRENWKNWENWTNTSLTTNTKASKNSPLPTPKKEV